MLNIESKNVVIMIIIVPWGPDSIKFIRGVLIL